MINISANLTSLCSIPLSFCYRLAKVPLSKNSALCRDIILSIITNLALNSLMYLPRSLTISSRWEPL
jgi:hypothetical protein